MQKQIHRTLTIHIHNKENTKQVFNTYRSTWSCKILNYKENKQRSFVWKQEVTYYERCYELYAEFTKLKYKYYFIESFLPFWSITRIKLDSLLYQRDIFVVELYLFITRGFHGLDVACGWCNATRCILCLACVLVL